MEDEELEGVRAVISEIEERISDCDAEIDNRPNLSKEAKRGINYTRAAYKSALNILYKEFPQLRER